MITSVVCRLSGVVAYSDGSSEPFDSTLQPHDIVAVVDKAASENAIYNASSMVNSMLEQLPGTDPVLTGKKYQDKTPVSMQAQMSGRITRDDGTWADFIVVWDPQIGRFVPTGGTNSVWEEIVNDIVTRNKVDLMFKAVNNGVSAFA